MATRLSDLENYRIADEYELAQVQKSFVLNFVTSFLPITLTAYAYVTYGAELVPNLMEFLPLARLISAGPGTVVIYVDASRLQEEVIGLSTTAQLASFCEEIVVPYVQRRYKRFYRHWRMRHYRTVSEQAQLPYGGPAANTPFIGSREVSLLACETRPKPRPTTSRKTSWKW